MKKLFTLFLVILFTGFINLTIAQISHGGTPYSTMFQLPDTYQTLSLQQPDMEKIHQEDQIEESLGGPGPWRMGVSVEVNKNMKNAGTWTEIEGVGKVWRLALEVKGAQALGVYYNNFYIPEGGQLFLYNKDKRQVIGSFTHDNNPPEKLFATQFIEGDKVTLEYFQPENVKEEAQIDISELAYAYRFIDYSFRGEDDAWWCMIDVACEEGDGWENQIDGVARISIKIGGSYYWCSGSLINNTENDRTPYFLTASHCGGTASASDLNQWIFYFNYQAATCGGNAQGYNSKTGCAFKAHDPGMADPDVPGSDFYLVRINGTIPDGYGVFYNGWNRTNSNEDAPNGVGIHHPAGDIKKISTYSTPLQSSTFWNGQPTHWKLIWAETVNGKSIMQGGSSGSPVFDANGLIMGDLTGGYTSNSCENPSPAYYGKMWYSWDQNGNTNSTQLEPWLDPNGTGIEKLPGISWQVILPEADFTADTTDITQSDTIHFTDLSGPGIYEWLWVFEGGDPDTAYIKNPSVVYVDTGYFDVSLYVVNGDGTDSLIQQDYIHVNLMEPPVADFYADDTIVTPSQKVRFYDASAGTTDAWAWKFEGASPDTSNSQNPLVRYSDEGVYTVKLVAYNLGGSDTIIKENYITVTSVLPEADFEADDTHIMEGESVNFSDLSTGNPVAWYWSFEGGTPDTSNVQNPENIVYSEGGAYSVALTVDNGIGTSTKVIEDYILVDFVGMDDLKGPGDFRIYPNPGTGIFVIQFAGTGNNNISLKVTDAFGRTIRSEQISRTKGQYILDLNDKEKGIYFVSIGNGDKQIMKKVSLIK